MVSDPAGPQSYVELLTCLQMARDSKEPAEKLENARSALPGYFNFACTCSEDSTILADKYPPFFTRRQPDLDKSPDV